MRLGQVVVLSILVVTVLALPAAAAPVVFLGDTLVYGGPGEDYMWGSEVRPGGGLATAITTLGFGVPSYGDYYGAALLVWFDEYGGVEAQYLVVGPSPAAFFDLVVLPDDSIFMVGMDYRYQPIIARAWPNGTVAYYRTLVLDTVQAGWLFEANILEDGRIVVSGGIYTSTIRVYAPLLLIVDPNGTVIEARTYSLPGYTYALGRGHAIVEGTVYLVGEVWAGPGFIVAVNLTSGTPLWAETVGDPTTRFFRATNGPDGILIVGGHTAYGSMDGLVVSVRANGSIAWAATFQSPAGDDYLMEVDYEPPLVAVSGYLEWGPYGGNDTLVVLLTEDGEARWTVVAGGPGNDWTYEAYIAPDRDVIITGGWELATVGTEAVVYRLPGESGLFPCIQNSTNTYPVEIIVGSLGVSPITPVLFEHTPTLVEQPVNVTVVGLESGSLCTPALTGGVVVDGNASYGSVVVLLAALIVLALLWRD